MNALIVISLLGVFAMMADVLHLRRLVLPATFIGLLAAICLNIQQWSNTGTWYNEMLVFDHYGIAFSIAITVIALFWILIRPSYFSEHAARPELPSLR